MTLNPICENVEISEGVPLTVTGVAQCKVYLLSHLEDFVKIFRQSLLNAFHSKISVLGHD